VPKIELGSIGAVPSPDDSGSSTPLCGVSAQLRAGADHVAISVIADGSQPGALVPWRELADRLILA
jgi:hypothetical protein